MSNPKPPEPATFFVDHSLGNKKVAAALRLINVQVEVHEDHFPIDAKDEEWIREVGRRGWIVLTKDDRIRYRLLERAALLQARVAMFTLTSGNLTGEEMAQAFVKALPRIYRFLTKYSPPFIARITRGGEVSMIFSGAE